MEKELDKVEIVENTIEYKQPKFWHKILANLIDIVIFFFVGLILFSTSNTLIVHSKSYEKISDEMEQIRLNSGLYYVNVDDEIVFANEYVDSHVDYPTYTSKINNFLLPILEDVFPTFLENECGADVKEKYLKEYDEFRLQNVDSNGNNYFVIDGKTISENPLIFIASNYKDYYNNVYTVFLKDYALGYLNTYHETFKNDTEKISKIFIFIEIPSCLFISFILTYVVPPLFFKRGRKTLGKALYKIALMDERLLSPSLGKFFTRVVIFLFEIIVSIFTFGIPLILSFTLMAFSKMHQGFPDYMTKVVEVSSTDHKIFMSYDEAKLAELPNNQRPIDFKMEKPL